MTFDFTFAHPHAVKPISRNAAIEENFEEKLRFCAMRRKFMYSYPPGKLIDAFTKCWFCSLSKGHITHSDCCWKQ